MPTRKGYGTPQRPHRPQHKPQPEQNQSLAQPPSRRRTNPKGPCYEGIIVVMAKYGRRETAPLATCVVFASSLSIVYGAPDLTASDGPGAYVGLSLIVMLSAALLIHQALINLRDKLYHGRRPPTVYQALSVLTGSGYYRWE